MVIEDALSEAYMQVLWDHIQAAWRHLGKTEPFRSVLNSEQFSLSNIDRTESVFYGSGEWEADRLLRTLERNNIALASLKSCLEYGCGLGRMIRWLAHRFERCYGYDISDVHLKRAGEYLAGEGISNVTLRAIQKVQDINTLPKVDLIYTIIVLQHNPPPLIAHIIGGFLRALNPGGVAYFQTPTYREGYRFVLKEYLSREATRREMEMHVLPQGRIFDIASKEGGAVLESIEDHYTGFREKEVSNTFVIQKK